MTTLNHMAPGRTHRRPTASGGESSGVATQLTPRVVAAWESRLGVSRQRMVRPSRFLGGAGIREWRGGVDVVARAPEQFRAVRFDRQLSMTSTFCALHSAARIERTADRIVAEPSEVLLASVTSLRGRTTLRRDGRDYEYSAGDLVFVSMTSPFAQTAGEITDPSGMAIPLPMLGKHRLLAERPRRPITKPTPLSRAAAGFLRRFAADTAAGAAAMPSADAELAAVDLIAAALAELVDADDYRLQDDSLFNHQTAIDLIARRHRDPSFTPDAIAEELHLSRRQLYRLFEHSDQSLATRIAEMRVETAREMLVENPWLPIGNVSAASGFGSVATFRNRFKARHGVGPVEYRQRATR